MNRRQKLVQERFLDDEEKIIKRLKTVYGQSLKDINGKVASLDTSIEQLQKAVAGVGDDDIGDLARAFLGSKKQFTPEEAKETLQSMIQSKVYQKKYQAALKKQVGDILDTMQEKEFKMVSDYLTECYENGFVGVMYDLTGQGIPLCFPLDQEAMVQAVQIDSKISKGLYSRLGEDVSLLKRKITAQVSRGVATGMSYQMMAKQLAAESNIGFNNAVRITRTEGHRIQCQSAMDACYKARDRGAEVVKQWDSTLDGRTRESHIAVDHEIRELDEPFSNGLMFPSDPHGKAAEVINCRCALLQEARWALEGSFTKMNNFTKQIEEFDSPEDYEEFKKAFFSKENRQYMNYVERMEDKYETKNFAKVLDKMTDREYNHYSKLLKGSPLYNRDAVEWKDIKAAGKGLSAKISGYGIPEHDEPILLKTIDFTDKRAILQTLTDFEKNAIMENVETACVITKGGKVYKCFGVEDRVFPDYDFGDDLIGAIVSHNHPISVTEYSFSSDDFELFQQYGIKLLRGCDEKYTYELSRYATLIDDEPEEWDIEENYYHAIMIMKAKEYGVGYRRWKND